jgi:hypothetical protein
MALSSGFRVVHYLSFLCCFFKTMSELTDNIENKLTKHNTENSNNVQHEPHCLKPWVNSLTTYLFSMLSVSSPKVLSSGVRVVHYLSFLCCV